MTIEKRTLQRLELLKRGMEKKIWESQLEVMRLEATIKHIASEDTPFKEKERILLDHIRDFSLIHAKVVRTYLEKEKPNEH